MIKKLLIGLVAVGLFNTAHAYQKGQQESWAGRPSWTVKCNNGTVGDVFAENSGGYTTPNRTWYQTFDEAAKALCNE